MCVAIVIFLHLPPLSFSLSLSLSLFFSLINYSFPFFPARTITPFHSNFSVFIVYIGVIFTRSFSLWSCRLGLLNTPTASRYRGEIPPASVLLPSRLGLQNTPTASLHSGQTPQQVSWIRQSTIWWLDSNNAEALENAEYPFIAIAPRFTRSRNDST